ncbi:hypothetical protein N7462_009191 [Penicillium macrosclerotiorum]|uniref:uncharacterized protein n=1 Tax=Penicillium macrosclerotiorum TaxID=303699 RepID=UPI002546D2E5|nr:uncharacterized protein N7462_009191 [Penicillium macrosclerotiorum]KAJ5673752.1 hypothetical protein N7462_009191 [Penicillium macrosclerotiorum]
MKNKPAPKSAVSFDAIIQSDRQKKQNEQLANQLLGKNRKEKGRRASAPGAITKASAAKPGSLASRIGPLKRTTSQTFTPRNQTKKPNPAPATTGPTDSRTKPTNKRRQNAERLLSVLESGHGQAHVRKPGGGLSIKGASGPFVVIGSNFAPGTTAADIQSALEPVSGPMMSCRVISHHPTVTAEFEYEDKLSAEGAVANFDRQRADGRILSMKLQPPGTSTSTLAQNSFNKLREQADRQRRSRRADPSLQDGSYGFGDQGTPMGSQSGLYSDQMMVDTPQQKQNRNRQRR